MNFDVFGSPNKINSPPMSTHMNFYNKYVTQKNNSIQQTSTTPHCLEIKSLSDFSQSFRNSDFIAALNFLDVIESCALTECGWFGRMTWDQWRDERVKGMESFWKFWNYRFFFEFLGFFDFFLNLIFWL